MASLSSLVSIAGRIPPLWIGAACAIGVIYALETLGYNQYTRVSRVQTAMPFSSQIFSSVMASTSPHYLHLLPQEILRELRRYCAFSSWLNVSSTISRSLSLRLPYFSFHVCLPKRNALVCGKFSRYIFMDMTTGEVRRQLSISVPAEARVSALVTGKELKLLAAHSGGSVLYLTLWDLETARVLRRFHHSLHQLEADYRIPSTWSASSDVFCLKTEANSAAILLKLNGRHALLHVDLATGTLRNGPICAMGVRQRLLSAESADIAVACAAGPEECLLHLRYPYAIFSCSGCLHFWDLSTDLRAAKCFDGSKITQLQLHPTRPLLALSITSDALSPPTPQLLSLPTLTPLHTLPHPNFILCPDTIVSYTLPEVVVDSKTVELSVSVYDIGRDFAEKKLTIDLSVLASSPCRLMPFHCFVSGSMFFATWNLSGPSCLHQVDLYSGCIMRSITLIDTPSRILSLNWIDGKIVVKIMFASRGVIQETLQVWEAI